LFNEAVANQMPSETSAQEGGASVSLYFEEREKTGDMVWLFTASGESGACLHGITEKTHDAA
jgi:hypothetical protein